ncbi:IS3 family transposase [Mesomycoplasma hyorhinis]
MTFKQFHKAIANYIYYYNYKRIKDKINECLPLNLGKHSFQIIIN